MRQPASLSNGAAKMPQKNADKTGVLTSRHKQAEWQIRITPDQSGTICAQLAQHHVPGQQTPYLSIDLQHQFDCFMVPKALHQN